LAAGSGDIQDRVDNGAQVDFPRTVQTLDRLTGGMNGSINRHSASLRSLA
jgi:hypothetical protein